MKTRCNNIFFADYIVISTVFLNINNYFDEEPGSHSYFNVYKLLKLLNIHLYNPKESKIKTKTLPYVKINNIISYILLFLVIHSILLKY